MNKGLFRSVISGSPKRVNSSSALVDMGSRRWGRCQQKIVVDEHSVFRGSTSAVREDTWVNLVAGYRDQELWTFIQVFWGFNEVKHSFVFLR